MLAAWAGQLQVDDRDRSELVTWRPRILLLIIACSASTGQLETTRQAVGYFRLLDFSFGFL